MSKIVESGYIFRVEMRPNRVLQISPYCYISNSDGRGTDDKSGEGGICLSIFEPDRYCNFPLSPDETVKLRKWLQSREFKRKSIWSFLSRAKMHESATSIPCRDNFKPRTSKTKEC